MKKTTVLIAATFTTAALLAAVLFSTAALAQQRTGYVKPEIRGAKKVTRDMLAPMRFTPQEVWYDAKVEDPRHGEYKLGYMLMGFDRDAAGNIVIVLRQKIVSQLFSVEVQKRYTELKISVSPNTGRAVSMQVDGELSGVAYWIQGIRIPPESRAEIHKKAYFDWNRGVVRITYGDNPEAPERTVPIENGSVFPLAYIVFMFKLKGLVEDQVYHFRFFDIYSEEYMDYYLKFEKKQGRSVYKYSSVQQGWGAATIQSFWFGPPTESAPNGLFEKIISNPLDARYLTFIPVPKEQALEPVTPIVD